MTLSRLRWWAAGAAVPAAALALAWALTHPALALGPAAVRAVADLASATALGLTVVSLLEEPRRRAELTARARRPLIGAGALWLVAELIGLTVNAAQAAGSTVTQVSVRAVREFVGTAPGRAAVFGVVAAAVLTVLAVGAARGPVRTRALITAAAAGVVVRSITGHLAESVWGGLAVAGHALAAALWCGTLAALVLTVDTRGRWARVLPAFSRLALWCVTVLLAGGVLAALFRLDSPEQLYTQGYGRLLLAKIAVTGGLLVLAARYRSGWLAAARGHRVSAEVSQARSRAELALMAVALTLAAALTVTG